MVGDWPLIFPLAVFSQKKKIEAYTYLSVQSAPDIMMKSNPGATWSETAPKRSTLPSPVHGDGFNNQSVLTSGGLDNLIDRSSQHNANSQTSTRSQTPCPSPHCSTLSNVHGSSLGAENLETLETLENLEYQRSQIVTKTEMLEVCTATVGSSLGTLETRAPDV